MFDLPTITYIPERPLDPPCIDRIDHDWAAIFRCYVGDDDQLVKVVCNVTIADEIDPDSIDLFIEAQVDGRRCDINVSRMINQLLRADIVRHFEANFDEIYAYNHE
jgi:hypothetical protein